MAAWIDSHCHLQWEPERPDHAPADPEGDLERAVDAGVQQFVCVGTDLTTSRATLDLAERHPNVYATVGLHPHDASRFDDEWDDIVALARSSARVVAIGEAGFDLHYTHSPRAEQDDAFRRHVRLAHEIERPLMIHSREAWNDTFRVLDDEGVPARTIFHCFTGGRDEARLAIDRGCYLSFSGIVSFKSADDVRAAAALAPADRVLVETDSPYLAPVPHRGKPNEPAYLPLVGAALAVARGVTVDEIAALTRANAARVFGVER
jgi:TatD DNase family protein